MNGRFVSFGEVATGPRPARCPHPPIWVGGSSAAGIRRAARFGDAWHPIDPRLDWLREAGLPRLRAAAEAAARPVPALCPRINLRLEPANLDQDQRRTGVGSLAQVLRDLDELAALGAEYVVLDTYRAGPRTTGPPKRTGACSKPWPPAGCSEASADPAPRPGGPGRAGAGPVSNIPTR